MTHTEAHHQGAIKESVIPQWTDVISIFLGLRNAAVFGKIMSFEWFQTLLSGSSDVFIIIYRFLVLSQDGG